MQRTLVVIPARMQSSRLPDKPLADIAGTPMIVHVWRRAMAAEVGRVVVATDNEAIVAAVRAAGGEAVMTRADHASGSDRVFEAVSHFDPAGDFEIILNLQGDLPTLAPRLPRDCLAPLLDEGPDIATIAAEITKPEERTNPNVVKVVGTPRRCPDDCGRFTSRAPPPPMARARFTITSACTPIAASALERFVSLRPSPLEKREKLEQLRALEDGMRIDVTLVDTVPLGVDTPDDLELARRLLAG